MNRVKKYKDLIFENTKADDKLLRIMKKYNISFTTSDKIDWYCLCEISGKSNSNNLVRYIDNKFINVIISNGSNIAVALRYEEESNASVVLVKTFGENAKYLIKKNKI